MSYIDNNLMDGESVLYRTHLHWIIFLWPVIWLIIAVLFFRGLSEYNPIGGVFTLITVITGVYSFLHYKTSEFGITNKRVIVKVGIIRRNSLEVLLNKVEGIQVKQGIIGRILGYGTIIVSGTGGTQDPFHKISTPLEFRKQAQEQIASVQDSH